MKFIDIKTKTIGVILLVLLILLGAVYLFTPKLMTAAAQNYQEKDQQEAAMILEDRLIMYFPRSTEARDAAFRIGEQVLSSENRIYVGLQFTGGGANANLPVSTEKAITYLERVSPVQGNDLWKYNGFYTVGKLYDSLGDYEQAEHWFTLALQGYRNMDPNYEWKIAEVSGSLIAMYLESADYTKADALINSELKKENTKSYELSKYFSLQGDLYYAQGDYVKAESSYTNALELEKINWQKAMATQRENQSNSQSNNENDSKKDNQSDAVQINATLEMQPGYAHAKARLSMIQAITGDNSKQGGIAGEIYSGTSPVANVQVFLINEKEYDGRANNFEGISLWSPVLTDASGKFSFANIAPGRYFVVLGFVPEDLEGMGRFKGLEQFKVEAGKTINLHYTLRPKITIVAPAGKNSFQEGEKLRISWIPLPGAASYNINLSLKIENGYVSRVYRSGLTDTSYLFAPQGLQLREMNFASFDNSQQVSPSAIIGSFYPGAQIFFQVEALDQEGHAISDSEGYLMQLGGNYPWMEVTGTEHLTTGDQLLMERKYDEAIKAYQSAIAQNPGDVDALLSLARLYNYGWQEGTENMKQAVSCYQKILSLTNETFILEEAANAAVLSGDNMLALQIYRRFEDRMEPHSFWFHRMGELYFLTGQPEKAIDYYLKYLDGKEEFVDLGPVIAMLYVGDYPAARKLLQTNTYSEQPRNLESGEERAADVNLIIANLQRYASGTPSTLSRAEFKSYLNDIMQITGSNRSQQVQAFQDKVRAEGEKDILVQTLLELVRDRY